MTYVALLLAGVLLGTIACFVRLLAAQARQHGRERGALLDRLMHATGNTWTPPPLSDIAPDVPWEPQQRTYEQNPGRFPVAP